MNKLIIRIEKIDWLKLIDLTLKRQDWGKIYNLFVYGRTKISCVMKEFNFEESTAWFRLTVSYVLEGQTRESTQTDLVRYALKNFSLEDFKMHLNKKIASLLKKTLADELKSEAQTEYYQLRFYSWCIKKEQILEAGYEKDYDDIMSLSEELQEDCLDVLKDKTCDKLNEHFNNCVENYMQINDVSIAGFGSILDRLEE